MVMSIRREYAKIMININMRCIEIYLKGAVYDNGRRLTLTWDVLKFDFVIAVVASPVD